MNLRQPSRPATEQLRECIAYYYVAVMRFGLGQPTHVKTLKPWARVLAPYFQDPAIQAGLMADIRPLAEQLVQGGPNDTEGYFERLADLIELHDLSCSELLGVSRFELSLVGF